MPAISLPGLAADLRARVARAITFIEAAHADSATQLERARSASDSCPASFYVGRMQGFDLAICELRHLVGEDEQP